MDQKIFKLENNTEVFCKKNPNTPRIALCFNIKSSKAEITPGVEGIMARLFMQGTKNRSAEDIANELDSYAIEFSTDSRPDYIRLKFLCLNEDFDKALEIMADIIKNSTFEDFDKELVKMEGEIIAELDSPRAKVIDNYYANLFKNHPYGNTNTKILDNIKNITKTAVLDTYNSLINSSKKVISVVGDIDFDTVERKLNEYLGGLPDSKEITSSIPIPVLTQAEYAEIIKPDANQAHIIKGWLAGTSTSEDYPALLLLNVILGASGLSSRLFLELRDKKGLAYVVRSSYETFAQAADFYIYIATEPKNINVSLDGFKEEIEKIKKYKVSEEELENAKINMLGKWAFTQETNNNQAILYAKYGIQGLGFDFNDRAKEKIKTVTAEDVQRCANKYLNDTSVVSILKP